MDSKEVKFRKIVLIEMEPAYAKASAGKRGEIKVRFNIVLKNKWIQEYF